MLSCKSDKKDQDEAFKQQIEQYKAVKQKALEVHDQVMPKTSRLMELSGQLQEQITEENQLASTQAINDLNAAHKAMFDWMADYNTKFPFEEAPPKSEEILDQKVLLLAQEVDEIVAIQEQTTKAIYQAEALLNNQ